MRCLIVCCLLVLAVCQSVTYAIHLQANKVYEYAYEGRVKVGSTSKDLPASELKISSTIKFTGSSGSDYFIQFFDTKLESLNGLQGKDQFEPMPSVMARIARQFDKPFGFRYEGGHVSHFTAPPGISTIVLNICKGAIDLINFTFKNDRSFYELEDGSIFGICKSQYSQVKDPETHTVTLSREIDLNSCATKAAVTTGMASAVPNALSGMVGKSIETSVHYEFVLDKGRAGPQIRRAFARESQLATPFNLKSGHLSAKTEKTLTLVKITDKYHDIVCGDMVDAGELMYKLENVNLDIPVVMQELGLPAIGAQALLVKLAKQVNDTHIAEDANLDYQKLYELYRAMNASAVDHLWELNKMDLVRRSLFLSTIPESADLKMIKFIDKRLKASDLNETEASQLVVVGLNHVSVTPEIINVAKEWVKLPLNPNNTLLWKSVILSYGSLVRKRAIMEKSCSKLDIEPLMQLAGETLTVVHYTEEKMITILKGLGNAGCPSSLKLLRRILFEPVPGRLVTRRIRFSAVQSVRLMADIRLSDVQVFLRDVLVAATSSIELQMLAIKQLFETRPAHDMMNFVVNHLLAMEDVTVGIFAYSYLKSYSRSKTPDNSLFSTEATSAVSNLAPRFEDISSKYNKAIRIDWFNEDLLLGQAASYFIMNAVKNALPEHIIISSTSLAIGRILPSMEVGVGLHGLSDILQLVEPDSLATIMKRLNSSPSKNFTVSVYWQVFGQEVLYFDISRESLGDIKHMVLKLLSDNGGRIRAVKPFMVFEARYVQANCLGLQMEFSKYYHSLTRLDLEVSPPISPLTVNRTVILSTRGSLSMDKNFWTFFGINTNLFQCAAELKTKMSAFVPWDLNVRLDIDENRYSLEFPIPKETVDLVVLRSKMHAIIRAVGSEEKNIEIFPGVEDNPQSEECRWFVPEVKMCTTSLFGGTEDVFNRPASFFFESKYMAVKLVPAPQTVSDKVRITLVLYPNQTVINESDVDAASLLNHQVKSRASNCTAQPIFSLEIVAMKGQQKNAGWKLKGFHWEGRPRNEVSFILIKIGSPDDWMMCINTRVENVTDSEIHAHFGSRCKPYKVSLRTQTSPAPGFMTALDIILSWELLPDKIVEWADSVRDLIPGFMYSKGFERIQRENEPKQISGHIIPTVHREATLQINLPKDSYVKHNILLMLRKLVGDDAYKVLKESAPLYI